MAAFLPGRGPSSRNCSIPANHGLGARSRQRSTARAFGLEGCVGRLLQARSPIDQPVHGRFIHTRHISARHAHSRGGFQRRERNQVDFPRSRGPDHRVHRRGSPLGMNVQATADAVHFHHDQLSAWRDWTSRRWISSARNWPRWATRSRSPAANPTSTRASASSVMGASVRRGCRHAARRAARAPPSGTAAGASASATAQPRLPGRLRPAAGRTRRRLVARRGRRHQQVNANEAPPERTRRPATLPVAAPEIHQLHVGAAAHRASTFVRRHCTPQDGRAPHES